MDAVGGGGWYAKRIGQGGVLNPMRATKESAPISSRYSNLKKSFQNATRSLLTAFSKEDVYKAFPNFTDAEKGRLYRMFIQVIKSLHENIEEEFESLCEETQVGRVLDLIEQLVEEQNLDLLSRERTNIAEVKEKISKEKQDEIKYLTDLLEKTEEQNNIMSARLKYLKEKQQEITATSDVVHKLQNWTTKFEMNCRS